MRADFRRATQDDLAAMLEIVATGKDFLKRQRVNQWQMGDPGEAGLRQDIAEGSAWVLCQGGRVMATLALLYTPDPSYAEIDGGWANSEPYASIHRMCIHPEGRSTGLGRLLMEGIAARCRADGYTTIRVDTHAGNLPMQKHLIKNGFVFRGHITLVTGAEAGNARLAFDRVL